MFKFSPHSAAQLIQNYRDELMSYLLQRNHCPDTAADILQDVYVRLYGTQSSQPIHNPRAFLYRVVSNLSVDYHRSSQRQQIRHADESELSAVPDRSPSLEHQLYTQEQITLLQQAVAELPPRCRQVFILHKFRHYPYSRIIEELGISESTVEKHIVKAMLYCRKRMRELDV